MYSHISNILFFHLLNNKPLLHFFFHDIYIIYNNLGICNIVFIKNSIFLAILKDFIYILCVV